MGAMNPLYASFVPAGRLPAGTKVEISLQGRAVATNHWLREAHAR